MSVRTTPTERSGRTNYHHIFRRTFVSSITVYKTADLSGNRRIEPSVRLPPSEREKYGSSGLWHRIVFRVKRDGVGVLRAIEVAHAGLHLRVSRQPLRGDGDVGEEQRRQRGTAT